MPAGGDELQWIDLTDFTQGIQQGWASTSSAGYLGLPEAGKDGAAQVQDTYGCVATPEGGLEPAPRASQNGFHDFSDGLTLTVPPGTSFANEIRVHAVLVQTRMAAAGVEWGVDYEAHPPDVLMLALEFFYTVSSTTYSRQSWWMWDMLHNTVTKIADESSVVGPIARTTVAPQFGSADLAMVYSAPGSVKTDPGIPFAAWIASLSDPSFANPWVTIGGFYGDPASGTQPNATFAPMSTLPPSFRLCVHNDRLLFTTPFYTGIGGSSFASWAGGDALANDTLFFLGINDLTEINALNLIQISNRGVDSIADVVSGPGNQLMLVRNKEGGTMITGSLESPTIQQFPGVESAASYSTKPAVGPLGTVYGSPSGVFVWPGGDHSTPLGTGLQGKFWVLPHADDKIRNSPFTPRGTFAYRYPFYYCPNNWIFDIRTNAWFRLYPTKLQDNANGFDIAHYQVGYDGTVYTIPLDLARAGTDTVFITFDTNLPAFKWSWRSQPLVRGRNRQLKVREVTIVVSGQASFDVSIIGIGGETQTRTLSLNPIVTHPTMHRLEFDVECYDPEIKIVATSISNHVGDVPGNPRLHRLSVGYMETRSTNRGGA